MAACLSGAEAAMMANCVGRVVHAGRVDPLLA